AKKVIKYIEAELRSLCERPISKEELERTKSQLKRSLLLSMEDSGSRMNRLAKSEAYTQRYATLDEVVSRIESVSEEQVQNLSHELFHRRQRYTVILETQ
ncbi:MAG: insulinase family protein, partial [bacterium]